MKKILIIEDELAYTKLLNDQLSAKGFSIIEAKNGKEGLEKAKKQVPDLILLDIRMPVMDGMTMLGLLRRDKNTKNIKVIVLTNLEPDEKIIGQVVDNIPSYYFIKSDVKLNDLINKIEEVLVE